MHHTKYTKRERSFLIAVIIWVAAALPFVGLVQHNQFGYAVLAFIPILLATKLILRIASLMEADEQFQKRYTERLAQRPRNLCDVDREITADIVRATRPRCPRTTYIRK